jgi:hypothetical protein
MNTARQQELDWLSAFNRDVQNLAGRVEKLEQENRLLHQRLNLARLRAEHIEHYLGMREHTFKPNDHAWEFGQVREDVINGRRPKQRREQFHPENLLIKEQHHGDTN